jgi:hypothetical protein
MKTHKLPQDIKELVLDLILKKTDFGWQLLNYSISSNRVDLDFGHSNRPDISNSFCFKLDDLEVSKANLNIWINQVRAPYMP